MIGIRDKFQVRRALDKGTHQGGEYKPGPTELVDMTGSVQPVTGRREKREGEGTRQTAVVKVYCYTPIYAASETDMLEADVVLWQGGEYRVTEAGQRTALLPHWWAVAELVKRGARQ